MLLLAFVLLVGVGSLRSFSLLGAITAALCLWLLPPLGIVRTWGFRGAADVVALALWSIVLVGSVPLFFPGEREIAVREGVQWLGRPLTKDALTSCG